ncbi:MAG: tripartite tricarboxylate transporter permease, partial [Chloroflexota bacterium]
HKMTSLIPSRQEAKDSAWPILRGTGIGFFLGLIPGMTSSACSFISYVAERKCSKHPEKFGTGLIEGVAGPETANNAHCMGALVPLFAVGIPASPTVAVLMGAFMMNGLIPGPMMMKEHADVAWGVIASLYIGNVMLLILNLPLISVWVQVLKIPYSILFAFILTFTVIGAYSINNSIFDVVTMTLFGLVGYLLKKMDFPLAPAVLTLILGPIMERNLRRTLEMSQGDFSIFLTRPIAMGLMIFAALILLAPALKFLPIGNSRARAGGADC